MVGSSEFMSTAAISLRRKLAGNARHNPLAAIGVVLVIIFVIFALFAPWIAPQDPASIHLPARLDSPSSAHWFGTDELGRDILSRVIHGARISMLVGTCVVLTSLALGLIIGSIAGYYGGGIERISVIPRNSAGDRFHRLPRSRHLQSGSRAISGRMGWVCAPRSRTSSRRA